MDPSTKPTTLLESVLAHALELRDDGQADWLERAVEQHPELRDAVAGAARDAELMPRIFGRPVGDDPALGRVLGGRFRLVEAIGAGAMGVVYLAEDLELVRTVAVKVLRAGLLDPALTGRRFLREAEAMAAVQHPSIISVHDRGTTDEGAPYIVMEWVDGIALTEIAERASDRHHHKRSEDAAWLEDELGVATGREASFVRTVVRWVADLASGLELVHGAGVLHRDIKPSNVLVRKSGVPVLLDFGLALLDSDSTLTRGEAILGTPAYMPPEALVRGRNHRVESDVYSLTATLYNLLTLRPPYQGTPTEVLAGIATREPMRAGRLRPGLPRELQAILDKGMHRRPRSRYASAAALEADLRAFLEFRPIEARPVSAAQLLLRRLARSSM
ncbi:MAG: serine/threonine-protein kinase, partial [Planctomycetota bacterium]|nr:serine/threonine-protein kinase [Planctomycetota bacterium]